MTDKIVVKRTISKPASEEQKLFLINQLEQDLMLARNQFSSAEDGRKLLMEKWEELAKALNAIGGANKTGPMWKKYFEDLRNRTKTKYAKLKFETSKSGINGTDPLDNLDDLENRIINIISIDAVDGDGSTQELGLPINSSSPLPSTSKMGDYVSTPTTYTPPKTKRTRVLKEEDNDEYFKQIVELKKEKNSLLKQQLDLEREKLAMAKRTEIDMNTRMDVLEEKICSLEAMLAGQYLDQ